MKRTALALTLILALLFSAITGAILANLAKANFLIYLPTIVIQSDGSIVPETEFIKQTGNVYTLTWDLSQKYSITIQRSNIVFDGAGYAINGSMADVNAPIGGYSNMGLSLEGVTNVTVKDVEASGFINRDFSMENCRLCVVLRVKAQIFFLMDSSFNTIAESNIGEQHRLIMRSSSNNIIKRNSITSVDLGSGNSNAFLENNFAGKFVWPVNEANSWDNGSIGNYWSDYSVVDADQDGIGDAPYIINAKNQDNYPLMSPVKVTGPIPHPVDVTAPTIAVLSPDKKTYDPSSNITLNFTVNEVASQITYSLDGAENVTITGNITLTDLSTGDHNVTVYATDRAGNIGASETINFTIAKQPEPEPFPTIPVAVASGASLVAVSVGLLVYFKKRKNHSISSSTISNNN